jgi:hypothetical protein
MHPDEKEETAFSTGRRLWQFTVLPFGRCIAPATLERVMDSELLCPTQPALCTLCTTKTKLLRFPKSQTGSDVSVQFSFFFSVIRNLLVFIRM